MKEILNMSNEAVTSLRLEDSMAVLITTIIVSLVICFLGLKLTKVLSAITGALIGAVIGFGIAQAFDLSGFALIGLVAGGAVVIGVLSWFLYRVGIFLLGLCYGFGLGAVVIHPRSFLMLGVCLLIGILLGVMAAVFMEPGVILTTSISGGLTAGVYIVALLGLTDLGWVGYVAGAVVAVIGIVVQFRMHSKQVGKKEKKHSEKFKEEISRESEVEKARKLLEDVEDDDM